MSATSDVVLIGQVRTNSSSSQLSLNDPVSARTARSRAFASINSLRMLSCLDIVGTDGEAIEGCGDLSVSGGECISFPSSLFGSFVLELEGNGRSHLFGRGGGLVRTLVLSTVGDVPPPVNDASSRLRFAPNASPLRSSTETAKEYANEFDESW